MLLNELSSIRDLWKDIYLKYDSLDIIFLYLAAILSGAEGWAEIHQFATNKLIWLCKYRKFEHGIPSEDTISRVMRSIDATALNTVFMAWINTVKEILGQPLVAINGKTLKLSRDGDKHDALHSITVWCQQNDLVIAQMKSAGKK